jgi:hypothetical protein
MRNYIGRMMYFHSLEVSGLKLKEEADYIFSRAHKHPFCIFEISKKKGKVYPCIVDVAGVGELTRCRIRNSYINENDRPPEEWVIEEYEPFDNYPFEEREISDKKYHRYIETTSRGTWYVYLILYSSIKKNS